MACDICGAFGTPLNSLLDNYQTDEIKQICPRCENAVNKQLRSIQSMTRRIQIALLKRFMTERCTKKGDGHA